MVPIVYENIDWKYEQTANVGGALHKNYDNKFSCNVLPL